MVTLSGYGGHGGGGFLASDIFCLLYWVLVTCAFYLGKIHQVVHAGCVHFSECVTLFKKVYLGDFPGGSVVKIPCS